MAQGHAITTRSHEAQFGMEALLGAVPAARDMDEAIAEFKQPAFQFSDRQVGRQADLDRDAREGEVDAGDFALDVDRVRLVVSVGETVAAVVCPPVGTVPRRRTRERDRWAR